MVYIHIPFCKSFCTYCDFYSEICDSKVQNVFVERLLEEISARKEEIEGSNAVRTLYFGGGTPSILPLGSFEKIVKALGNGPYSEFTVEVNPEDVVTKGEDYIRGLAALGVNRISMGVQSMDDGILKWMNRRHNSSQVRQAVQIIRNAGIDNLSLDLIFGITHLTMEQWSDTISKVLELRPKHISAYQLSIEEGSALHQQVVSGRYTEASQEQCSEQYYHLCDRLRSEGFHHYEISNFALPGFEAVHNSAYWTRQPYVGLGPGAHSLKGERERSWNSQNITSWTPQNEILTDEEIREERIMLGLRTDKGVDGKVIPESEWFVSDDIIRDLI